MPYYEYMSGELPDFPTLRKLYYRRLHVYASCLGARCAADRDELANDALVRAYLSLDRYDPSRPLTPWVYAVARNVIVDSLRARKRTPLPIEAADDFRSAEDVAATVESRDRVERARREIGKLPERDREIAMLVFYESLSAAEAGRILGMPSATVRWRLGAIRKRLRLRCGEDS